jgi:hypothetical protein
VIGIFPEHFMNAFIDVRSTVKNNRRIGKIEVLGTEFIESTG